VQINQRIEDVRTLANQTATVSFWAKANSGTPNIAVRLEQNFGSGGSSSVFALFDVVKTISTSWARYSFTATVPSISGKTLGAGSYLAFRIYYAAGSAVADVGSVGLQDNTFDLWGVQVEAGSVATAFQTATGTLQGELAACQRYYQRITSGATGDSKGTGFADSTTSGRTLWFLPVPLRIAATALEQTGTATDYRIRRQGSGTVTCSSVPTLMQGGIQIIAVAFPVASGLTAGEALFSQANASGAYLGVSAEL
jgi:hypothetical protein